MIKGVNRRIVEVNSKDTFFEKAVLYVRPECSAVSEEQLSGEAEDYVRMLSEIHRNSSDIKYRTLFLTAAAVSAAAGAVISALLIVIF